jgi:predicted permease
MWVWSRLEGLLRYGHYALRSFRKTPSFVTSAVAVLALGIGANTAIFTVIDGLMLRPLPVATPSYLERITNAASGRSVYFPSATVDVLQREAIFDGVCGFDTPTVAAEIQGSIRSVGSTALTGDCFLTLGVPTRLGRPLTASDDQRGSEDVVVITDGFWREHFAGQPNAIGATLRLDGRPYRIIGITAPGFIGMLVGFPCPVMYSAFHNPALGRMPASGSPAMMLQILVRRAGGAKEAQARLAAVQSRLLEATVSPNFGATRRKQYLAQALRLESATNGVDYALRKQYATPLVALFGLSFLVLLISCVNLANLILIRTLSRRREIAVRMAVGARRIQIITQLTVESSLLALGGAAAGAFFAYVSSRALLARVASSIPGFSMTASPDTPVLMLTMGIAVCVSLLFGLLPGWRSTYLDIAAALKEGGRSMSGSRSIARRSLIIGQTALAMALICGTSLFVYSLRALYMQPLGFRPDNVVYAELFPLPDGYKSLDTGQYYQNLIARTRNVPGVLSASIGGLVPFVGASTDWASLERNAVTGSSAVQVSFSRVSDQTLQTLGIALLGGRDFAGSERAGQRPVAIISQSLAHRLLPGQSAVGQRLVLGQGSDARELEIVGVAQDARIVDPKIRDPFMVYTNYWQEPQRQIYPTILARVQTGFSIDALRKEIESGGREYLIQGGALLDQRNAVLLRERLLATLATAFGVVALILAGAGLYSLLSYYVAARTNEFGVRLALGANSADIVALVIREAAALLAWGLSIGLALTVLLGRTIEALLYGVKPLDPTAILSAIVALSLASTIAVLAPMRRAVAVEPMSALRCE